MSKERRGKASRPAKATKSAKHRYRIWFLGIAVVMTIALVGSIASQGPGTSSPAPSTPTPSLLELPRISPGEVEAKLAAGSNIVIVDTRSKEEYERTHIVGAISIPVEEIEQRYSVLRSYDEIITYCT
ncbi:rhodanese-like domain-containing protein [Chloroflexota bacterium]